MRFPTPLVPARLIQRYKRFLADCKLDDGSIVTAHCANPGSMMGLADPGLRVWLEPNDDPKKKLNYGLKLVEPKDGGLVGVDTSLPNKVIGAALRDGRIAGLTGYGRVAAEQRYSTNSRIDFLLTGPDLPDTYVEVKSVTLSRRPGLVEFPDSVTARGTKHLHDLMGVVAHGHRAVMLYFVQRSDAERFAPAADIDPTYAAALTDAMAAGVDVIVLGSDISITGLDVGSPLPGPRIGASG